ncbi:hypothetical protein ES704_02514 [subsurface metagenome]
MNALSIAMKFKLRPIFKDIALTFITQAIVLVSFFFIYRLIAKNFGPDACFNKYSCYAFCAGVDLTGDNKTL